MSDRRRFAVAGMIGIVFAVLSAFPIAGGAYFLWPGSVLIDGFFTDPHSQFVVMIPLAFVVNWALASLMASVLLLVVKRRAA
jgi:hypothetical protein